MLNSKEYNDIFLQRLKTLKFLIVIVDFGKVGNTASLSSKLDEKEDGGVDFLPGVQKRLPLSWRWDTGTKAFS